MKLLLFDVDGTLVNARGAGALALAEAMREVFGIDELSELVSTVGRTDRGIVAELFAAHDIDDSAETFERLRSAYVQRLRHTVVERQGHVLEGVAQMLAEAADREDLAVGLLTGNMRRACDVKLAHFALADHFRFGGFGDDHHDRDDVAREALHQASAAHHERVTWRDVWVIGDTPLDVSCARAIGARSVGVATGLCEASELAAAEPDVLLESLGDVRGFWRSIGD